MYLRGSKWSLKRRRRPTRPFVVMALVVLIGAMFYIDRFIVPDINPIGIPTPTPTRDPGSYVAEGQQLFTTGKVAKAVEAYKQAVKSSGNDVSIYLTLAQLQIYNHDYKDAETNAGNALLLAPNNATAKAMQGYAQYMLADPNAESTLQGAIEMDPNNPLGHAYYAQLIADQINEQGIARPLGIQEAIDEAHKAVDLGPNLVEAHQAYGFVLFETNNIQKAVEEYQAAIAINKNIADLYTGLGICYSNSNETANQAIEALLKAVPLNPTDPIPYIYLARAYNQKGQYPMAIQYADLALQNSPTDPVRYAMLGVYQRRNQQNKEAVASLELALKGGTTKDGKTLPGMPLSKDTNVLLYYAAYGMALDGLDRCAEALPVADALLKADPDNQDNVFNANTIQDDCKQKINGTFTPTPGGDESGMATPAP